MSGLSDFAITKKWPAKFPDRLQLYSLNTPNGVKASILLRKRAYPTKRISLASIQRSEVGRISLF